MPRGGARPGAGRPSAAAAEEKRSLPARMMAKCQEKIQRRLPELVDRYLHLALEEGDKDALKWLIERGMGKAAVAQQAVADTEIKVVLGAIPRPGRANGSGSEPGGEGGDFEVGGSGLSEPEGGEGLSLEDDGAALAEGAEEEEEAVKPAGAFKAFGAGWGDHGE